MSQSTTVEIPCPDHILRFLVSKLGASAVAQVHISHLKSAQQQVLVISNIAVNPEICKLSDAWTDALKIGRNTLVVRIWQASCCWWNLHRNEARDLGQGRVVALACSEVAGYRIAKKALPHLHLPSVLHFSQDNPRHSVASTCTDTEETDNNVATRSSSDTQSLWAMFSNVGYDSDIFASEYYRPDHSWMQGMITTRMEFGFDEPHPRWGRVPVDQSVDYALSVLRNVTMPLHRCMYSEQHSWEEIENLRGASIHNGTSNGADTKGITYYDMVAVYEDALIQMKESMTNTTANGELRDHTRVFNNSSDSSHLLTALELLGKGIGKLKEQSQHISSLFPVLCHMDCQPQNLLFAQPKDIDKSEISSDAPLPQISSVLDWEEAAYADPRFDLLMLCRKVCANREQAETVWNTYIRESNIIMKGAVTLHLGPLQPWLELETVHSLTTLLLQSMNLLGGGRSPWETKPDLWGKIQREIQRLVHQYGWTVCDIPAFRSSTS